MTITAKPLLNSKYLSNTSESLIDVGSSTSLIIDKATVINTDSSAVTVTLNIVPLTGSVEDSNLIIKELSIAAGATTELTALKNHVLSTQQELFGKASVSSKISIRVSGREVKS